MLTTDLQDLLWGNRREPLFVAQPGKARITPMAKGDALQALASGTHCFFGPVPRVGQGLDAQACAPSFDGLWCDIDRAPGADPVALLDEAETSLGSKGLSASAVVASGSKGIHVYIKLNGDLPISRIEDCNKWLRVLLGGDACWSRAQIMRNPGTVNEASGRHAEIISFHGTVEDAALLDALVPRLQPVKRATKPSRAAPTAQDEGWLAAAEELGGWGERPWDEISLDCLAARHRHYLMSRPNRGYRQGDKSRSQIEAEIVYRLVGKGVGASDAQVKEVADEYFARHLEEWGRRGNYYIDRTIRQMRRKHFENGWITSPLGGYPRKREAKYRHPTLDGLAEALALVDGQTLAEFVAQIVAGGRSRSTAYRIKDGLIRVGLIAERDRRLVRVQ